MTRQATVGGAGGDCVEHPGCPDHGKLLRKCSACGTPINRLSDQYVVIAPTWKRCNDLVCSACFALVMRSAQTIIAATFRGAEVYVQEPLGELGAVMVDLGDAPRD